MLVVEFDKIGKAEESLKINNINLSENLEENEILLEIILFPINPADILLIEGLYANKPVLPSRIGAECIAKVLKVGLKVKNVMVDDFVMPLSRNNWVQRKKVKDNEVIKLSKKVNIIQASMLKVNPASAYLMLNNYIKLNKKDTIIQNAANSGVGNYVIQLCKYYQISNINLVRNENLFKILYDMGASKVLTYDKLKDFENEFKSSNIKLFLDAVGGNGVENIASVLKENSTIINYGLLSNQNLNIASHNLIFRNISIKGFWLTLWLEKMLEVEKINLYNYLEGLINKRILFTEVQKIFDISDINEAVKTSKRYNRKGKILVSPNLQLYEKEFSNILN